MYVHTQEAESHLFPTSSRLSLQVGLAIQMLLGPHPPCLPPQTLRMLVKMMRVHSAEVIRAVLDQLCYSCVLEVSLGLPSTLPSPALGQSRGMDERESIFHGSLSLPSAPL